MREEISEPQHWRTRSGNTSASNSWTVRRHQHKLPAEAIDAAFEDETTSVSPVRGSRRDATGENATSRPDIIQSLSTQLALLEAQREQLQKLLDEAQG